MADERKTSYRQFDQSKELILGAGAINERGDSMIKTFAGKLSQSPTKRKRRNSMHVPGSGFSRVLDSLSDPMGGKPKTGLRKSHLRFRGPSMQRKTPNSHGMVGEYAPVADLVKGLKSSLKNGKFSLSPRPSGFQRMDCRQYQGEEMDAIDEHDDEQCSGSHFSPAEFGEYSPDNSVSKSSNFPNNFLRAPGAQVKTQRKGYQTDTGVVLSYGDIVSHQSTQKDFSEYDSDIQKQSLTISPEDDWQTNRSELVGVSKPSSLEFSQPGSSFGSLARDVTSHSSKFKKSIFGALENPWLRVHSKKNQV